MSVFPLPLTPMEYLFWCDDSSEYPITFPIQMRFSGSLDEFAFREGLRATLARHPMLNATIDDSGSWPRWVNRDDRLPYLDWSNDNRPLTHPDGVRIDLSTTPGLRVWVRQHADGSDVYLQLHHACCDGLAVQSIAEDLMLSYCEQIGTNVGGNSLRRLDPNLLLRRCGSSSTAIKCLRHPRQALQNLTQTVCDWSRLLRRNPSVMAPGTHQRTGTQGLADLFDFRTHQLNGCDMLRLKQIATHNGVTSNDILLRDLFRTLGQWNRENGDSSDGWLRINVPANDRGLADRAMPAANRLSFTFLTRRASACNYPRLLLQSIRAETESMRRCQTGKSFLRGINLASHVRGAIPWFLQGKRSFATICLSNVGRVFGRTPLPRRQKQILCGDVALERITGTPYIRPLTRAAITVISYANEMTINLRCDPRYFSPSQRQQFLDQYAEIIEHTLKVGR